MKPTLSRIEVLSPFEGSCAHFTRASKSQESRIVLVGVIPCSKQLTSGHMTNA